MNNQVYRSDIDGVNCYIILTTCIQVGSSKVMGLRKKQTWPNDCITVHSLVIRTLQCIKLVYTALWCWHGNRVYSVIKTETMTLYMFFAHAMASCGLGTLKIYIYLYMITSLCHWATSTVCQRKFGNNRPILAVLEYYALFIEQWGDPEHV